MRDTLPQTPRLAFYAPGATKAVLEILDAYADRIAAARFADAARQMARVRNPQVWDHD